jgi:hypothetical protein
MQRVYERNIGNFTMYQHMLDYAEAQRNGPPIWAKPPRVYSEECISAFYAELVDQAKGNRNPRKFSGFSWRILYAIAGPYPHEVFPILRERGMLKSCVIPGCYGHEEYELLV